jgi:hypothetical protein
VKILQPGETERSLTRCLLLRRLRHFGAMQRHCSLFKMVKGYFKDRDTARIFKDILAGVNKKT